MIEFPEYKQSEVLLFDKPGELSDWISEQNWSDYSKILIITDEHTATQCLPKVQFDFDSTVTDTYVLPVGEQHKSLDQTTALWQKMLDWGMDRQSLVVNLGGGVVCDIGGFAASTFKRGINFINIPTSLLAMTDASLGGKTGINFTGFKNQIGTFAHPQKLLIDPQFLITLPPEHLRSGLAESIKHAVIRDPELLTIISDNLPSAEMISRSLQVKMHFVSVDPKESGLRKALNFGHTIGHAIESLGLSVDGMPVLHGDAVAIGMICAARISRQREMISKEGLNQITNLIKEQFGIHPISEHSFDDLLTFMDQDKKRTEGGHRFVLLSAIGSASLDIQISNDEVVESFRYYNDLRS